MKKFLLIFFVFIGLFSVTNAEIIANQSYLGNNAEQEVSVDSSATYVEGYTYSLVDTILTNYVSDTTNETYINDFNNMISAFENSGKNVVVFRTKYSSSNYACIATYDSDVNVCFGSPLDRVGFILDDTSQTRTFSFFCNRQFKFYNITCTSERPFPVLNTYQCYEVYYSSTDVYKLTMSGSWLFSWDGTSYYYNAPEKEPDNPGFEGLTDTQKATIINSVVNSDEFKNIVPEHYRNQFFIIKNEWTNRYKVYFYPKQYYLKGRVFEANETEAITQKSYKIIATDSENFLWGVWQSINPFDYYVFSGYFNEDNTFNSYFYEYKDSHEMNQEYFSYEDEPIVYSSKDIGFVIYDISTNETTEDTENSISSTILKDDNGNEIEIVIPTEEGTENITFWDSIVQKIVNGIKAIFVPDFSNSLDFFEKLKSKFNFLFEVKDLVSGMFDKLVYQTEPPSITVDLTTSNSKYNWGSNAIALDMSWYEPYKPTVDIFICAFCYGIFFWNLFRKLANIVSGVSGEGAQSSKEGSK